MATQGLYFGYGHFPSEAPPTQRTLAALDRLENWRAGSLATAVLTAGLLPLSIAFQMRYPVAIACAFVAAALLALLSHVAREIRLTTLLIYPEFAHLPALTRKRRRLISHRSRRTLAREVRRTACPRPSCWLDRCTPPLRCTVLPLPDRVAAVRFQLLETADALEGNHDPDPACVALIRELLRDGASPLYNPNVPLADLRTTLNRANTGITREFHANDPVTR
jgi:hypothetical protein